MKVIEDFIKQYNKEFDYFQKLSQIVATKIEDQLFNRGIKAIVTYRAKRPDRLLEKLIKRNEEKKYKTTNDIFSDIVDLAGIRVSLYFPSEREIINEIINESFIIEKTKSFPNEAHTPLYSKRFSGYWATHYRVKIKEDNLTKRYGGTTAEIQVASVLMHAWSEVEHDLVYKPFSGNLSKEELSILDEINGLVLSGEIALERLQAAMAERTKLKNDITDKYELTNFLLNTIDKKYLNKIKLGNTFLLNNYLNTINKIDTKDFTNYIRKINIESDDTVTDQLLNMILVEYYDTEKPNLKKYFKNLNISDKKASAFEAFVKCWIVLEKATKTFLPNNENKSEQYRIPDFNIFRDRNILTQEEVFLLKQLRELRNYLLHGIETESDSDNHLINSYYLLQELTTKVVTKVENDSVRKKLKMELESI